MAAKPKTPKPHTPEELARLSEWNRLTKWDQYLARTSKHQPPGKRQIEAFDVIHDYMTEDEWLAVNTPFPFRNHHSMIPLFAGVACRYLRRLALLNNRNAIEMVASITVEMTEALTELLTSTSKAQEYYARAADEISRAPGMNRQVVETNAETMRSLSRYLPYWPMLRFLNGAANSEKQFQRMTDALKLGYNCPLNVSRSANFSLETPINSFVWKCLRHFRDVHWHISSQTADGRVKTVEEALEPIVFTKMESPRRPGTSGIIERDEIPIYKVSYELPPLSKATAKEWADKAIVPFVCSRFENFSDVPEFADILRREIARTRGQQRREIRKDIIRSLTSMARPHKTVP